MAEGECKQLDPPPWVIGRGRRPIEKWTRRELQRRAKKVGIKAPGNTKSADLIHSLQKYYGLLEETPAVKVERRPPSTRGNDSVLNRASTCDEGSSSECSDCSDRSSDSDCRLEEVLAPEEVEKRKMQRAPQISLVTPVQRPRPKPSEKSGGSSILRLFRSLTLGGS